MSVSVSDSLVNVSFVTDEKQPRKHGNPAVPEDVWARVAPHVIERLNVRGTSARVAKALNVTESAVSNWRNGKNPPMQHNLIDLLKELELDPEVLIPEMLHIVRNEIDPVDDALLDLVYAAPHASPGYVGAAIAVKVSRYRKKVPLTADEARAKILEVVGETETPNVPAKKRRKVG